MVKTCHVRLEFIILLGVVIVLVFASKLKSDDYCKSSSFSHVRVYDFLSNIHNLEHIEQAPTPPHVTVSATLRVGEHMIQSFPPQIFGFDHVISPRHSSGTQRNNQKYSDTNACVFHLYMAGSVTEQHRFILCSCDDTVFDDNIR